MRALWFLLLLAFMPVHAGHTPPKIILRVHVQTAGAGMSATQATQITIPPNDEIIQIRFLPELTERQLVDVQTEPNGYVHLYFDHPGTVTMDAFTAQNQGRIMVVLINGVVVYSPIIDEQISNGELIMTHPLQPNVIALLQEVARENVRRNSRT